MDPKIMSMAIIGGSALVAGLYYKYFSKSDIITQLKNEYLSNNKTLSKSIALRLMLAGVKAAEKRFYNDKPQLLAARRAAISNDTAYYELCQETLNTLQEYFDGDFMAILTKFDGKFTMNELQEISGNLPPMQLYHILYQYDQPIYEGTLPSFQQAKDIYVYYGTLIVEALKETRLDNSKDIYAERDLYFKFYYLNLKLNDLIYEKYAHSNIQIVKYVLFKAMAFEKDDDIKGLKKKIEIFERILLTY